MLGIFCMFVLTDLYPMSEKNPSIMEYFVYIWAVSSFAEEIRQVNVQLKDKYRLLPE